ncbi:MAG TPA: triose-phosphate isomerase [Planctomycetes bacterium]|nr:triose-phosphate isomerase [Planctomycetota bacterium]
MSRTPVIAGNWKMNLTSESSVALAQGVANYQGQPTSRKCCVFPALVHLSAVAEAVAGSAVSLGAQDCHEADGGAFTGEISAAMLKDVGVEVVLSGHSERRHIFCEDDSRVAAKSAAILEAGLDLMLCVGETLGEREAGNTFQVLDRQLGVLSDFGAFVERISVAYEPVWAIGTGQSATPEIAQNAHAHCRAVVEGILGGEAAASMPLLYGGSVNSSNAEELLAQEDVDGALVGGASLDIENFGPILDAVPNV